MRAWLLGNTTLRNPLRIKEALAIFQESVYNGHYRTVAEQKAFIKLLSEKGLVKTELGPNSDFDSRKWRSCFYQPGFITADFKKHDDSGLCKELLDLSQVVQGLSGRPYEVTPSGRYLAEAKVPAEEFDAFLRAMAAYQLPSVIEKFPSVTVFSPLFIVLEILAELENRGEEAFIDLEEMASIVMLSQDHKRIKDSADQIVVYRTQRKLSKDKIKFDNSFRNKQITKNNVVKKDGTPILPATLGHYADTNIRYLKATGLFGGKGRGIIPSPEKAVQVRQLLAKFMLVSDAEYLQRLYNGASLPSDSKDEAIAILESVVKALEAVGQKPKIPTLQKKTAREVNILRFQLESDLALIREEKYAAAQKDEWRDIHEELQLLSGRRGYRGAEAPAYLEWAVWRAFLAINSLINKPHVARRFSINTVDFTPRGTAPGNGPDAVFEFAEFVLVVEVTFTAGSRQEAAEGEPVRRHVAVEFEKYKAINKDVYGLFIAQKIDTNTAETFRSGTWYNRDDARINLTLAPLTILQFCRLFEAHFTTGVMTPNDVLAMIREFRVFAHLDAPSWKQKIHEEVERQVLRVAARPAIAVTTLKAASPRARKSLKGTSSTLASTSESPMVKTRNRARRRKTR